MKHVWKLGLIGVAAVALFPAGASAAHFSASSGGLNFENSVVENHVFSVAGSEVNCGEVTFSGTSSGAKTAEQSFNPKYEECTAFGFSGATVTTTGCVYTFKAATTGSHGTLSLSGCTAGGIVVTVDIPFIGRCTQIYKNQSIIGAANYANDGSNAVVVKITSTTTHAEVTTSDILCPLTVGTYGSGSYFGAMTMQLVGGTYQYVP